MLLVLQGMDTSGKGGVLRHTVGLVDPQGVHITSFKAPTEEERAHDFLWRIRKAVPDAGLIGVFDRSHYEDVLIARVRSLAPREEIEPATTRSTSSSVSWSPTAPRSSSACCTSPPTSSASGCSPGSTTRPSTGSSTPATSTSAPSGRTTARPTRSPSSAPTPTWRRGTSCPRDRKWYRNLAIGELLLQTLQAMAPQWPVTEFDVAEQKQRLLDEKPVQ